MIKAKKEVIERLKIVEGHVKRIQKMAEEGVYCLDIIHQSRAVQAALRKIDEIILHGHLHSCVFKDIHDPKSKREKLISEILDLFGKDKNNL